MLSLFFLNSIIYIYTHSVAEDPHPLQTLQGATVTGQAHEAHLPEPPKEPPKPPPSKGARWSRVT